MDDYKTLVGSFREGFAEGKVWKFVDHDEDGRVSVDYVLELSQLGFSISTSVLDIPDIISVFGQALTCVRDHSHDAIQLNLGQLFTALRDAANRAR